MRKNPGLELACLGSCLISNSLDGFHFLLCRVMGIITEKAVNDEITCVNILYVKNRNAWKIGNIQLKSYSQISIIYMLETKIVLFSMYCSLTWSSIFYVIDVILYLACSSTSSFVMVSNLLISFSFQVVIFVRLSTLHRIIDHLYFFGK